MQKIISLTVDQMPPKMQEAYKLSREVHRSRKEIASRMNISEDTVKTHIQRALCLIRKALSPHNFISVILLFMYSS